MTWKTLADALESALASALNDGEEGVGAPPLSRPKTAGTGEAPASWEEVVTTSRVVGTTAGEATQPATNAASRAKGTGSPARNHAQPQRGAGRPLLSDEVAGRTDCPAYDPRVDAALSPSLTPEGASAHETAPARRQALRLLRGQLVIIEGGRPAGGGGSSRAAYRSTTGRGRGSNLKLVV